MALYVKRTAQQFLHGSESALTKPTISQCALCTSANFADIPSSEVYLHHFRPFLPTIRFALPTLGIIKSLLDICLLSF